MELTGITAYLRELREARKISRAKLAAQLEISEVTVWRIETNQQEPSGSLLVRFVEAVQGSFDDIRMLLFTPGVTSEDGKRVAQERLNGPQPQAPTPHIEAPNPDRVLQAIEYLRTLDDKELIAVLIRLQTERR